MTQHAPAERLRVVRTTSYIRFLSDGCRVGLSAAAGLLVECPLPRSGSRGCCPGVSSVPGSVRLPVLGGPHVEYDGGDCALFVRVRTGYVTRRCVSIGDWVPTSDWTDTQAVEAHEAAARAVAARRRRSLLALRRLHAADAKLVAFGRAWWSAVAARVCTRWVQAAPQIEFDPSISHRDLSLARCWVRPQASDDDHDRVREARRAELSAVQYYTHRGHDVRDVSSEQLEPVSDGSWETHDLEIDGRPVDVKNVRDTKFGGFIVHPSPKFTKKENEEVAVCGVVDGRRIVGEASGEALAELERSARSLASALGLPRPRPSASMARWRRSLGPWLMDFTPEHYRSFGRRSVCRVLAAAARVPEFAASPPWAKAFIAFWSSTPDVSVTSLDPVDVSLRPLDVFVKSIAVIPRTRPGLFFFVLFYFLALARHGAWRRGIVKQDLFDFLFAPRSAGLASSARWTQWPLGLHDPLEVVYQLVETLDLMVEKNAQVLRSISSLALFGPGVLRACCVVTDQTTPAFTLLAYCGGCGKRPLWVREIDPALLTSKDRLSFGRPDPSPPSGNFLCPNCLKLICDACGFCEDPCSLNPSPRSRAARA